MFSLPEITRVSAMPTSPSLTLIPRQNVTRCASSLRGPQREIRFVNCRADRVQLGLQSVQELMQPRRKNVIRLCVCQLGAQHAHALLGRVAKTSRLDAG